MMMLKPYTWFFVLGIIACTYVVGGCSSTPEQTSSTPTNQDIRGDSDRFFHKMEHEEKNHPAK